ncbi:ImuA family protein [Polymorphobacter sp.]|uniref:ImuA family protein n=1 Tax=Polymorphobacter sp. TaxID=1909290 RepID=UPI003F708C55
MASTGLLNNAGVPRGSLNEIVSGSERQFAGAAGFTAMLSMGPEQAGKTCLWLRTERAERGSGRLHAPGLADLGLDPHHVLLGIMPDDTALLQASAEAARCPALGVLIVECWGNPRRLDMTMSRRLSLAAEASGVTVLLLRIGSEIMPSTAATRWLVASAPSAALPQRAPGHPSLALDLLRQRNGPSDRRWRLEWRRDDRQFRETTISGAGLPQPVGRSLAPAASEARRRSG